MTELFFRNVIPERTYSGKQFSDYRYYKTYLADDFKSRCGYTGCSDFWFGGKTNFQIDHFKPKSIYPELETNYSNLVYCCSYVNRAKGNDCGTYLDPVDTDYNLYFYRDEFGNIYPKEESESAKYMYIKLKLYLKRYSIIWMLEQLEQKLTDLRVLIESTHNELAMELYIQVSFKYQDYLKNLRAIQ
ncbi:MAG: hypothetical protein H6Q17_2625 [Bacteroidetes bacterium]|nr:hypothetical protein [Bacteroidota bacterium]